MSEDRGSAADQVKALVEAAERIRADAEREAGEARTGVERVAQRADELRARLDELAAAVEAAVSALKDEVEALREPSEAPRDELIAEAEAAAAREPEPVEPAAEPEQAPPPSPRAPACSPSRWPWTVARARRPRATCARTSSWTTQRRCSTRSTRGPAADMSQAGSLDRRGFLAAGGAGALLCTVGGDTVPVSSPEDVARVDAVAASLPRPAAARRDPIDRAQFPTPGPPARRPAPRVLDRGAHGGLGHRADRPRRVDEAPPPVAQAAQAARLRLPAVQRGLRRAARARRACPGRPSTPRSAT